MLFSGYEKTLIIFMIHQGIPFFAIASIQIFSIFNFAAICCVLLQGAGPMIPRTMGVISFREKCLANAKSQSRHCGENTRDRPLRKYWQFDRKTEKCVANRFRDCSAILNKVSRNILPEQNLFKV